MFAPMLLLWPLSVVITFILARSLADVPFDRALIERTDALARQAALASTRSDVTLPRAPEDFVTGDDDDVVYFQVIGPRSKLLIGQVDLPPPRLYDYPEPGRIKLRTATYRGSDVRIGYVYVDDGQADDGAPVLVQVAETLDKRTRLANEIIKGVIFPQFMILPVAVTLVWFGLSRGLAPLKSLQRLIRNRSPDDLSPIDPRRAPEEIAPLIDAFNDQLDRLRGNIEGQKRLSCPTPNCTFATSQACTALCASATVSAKGFSQKTALPALAAAMICSTCSTCGVANIIAEICGSASTACASAVTSKFASFAKSSYFSGC
jgi:two-component system sensor histidine kinase TctE